MSSTASSGREPALRFILTTLTLAIVGYGLLIPVLPKLVVQFEGQGHAQGDFASGVGAFGILVSVYALMQFVGSPILGALSDRFGRRKIILIATAGSAIDYVIMALAPSLGWLFVARVISGFTAGVLATANAYVADVTPPEKRAQSFGLIGAAMGVGIIIGPLIGGILGNYSLKLPFWFAAACSAANWLYGFFVLPESLKTENRRQFSWMRANPVGAILAVRRFPEVLGLIECYFCVALAQQMMYSIWTLYTDYRYGWSSLSVGLSLAAAGVMMALVQAVLLKRIVPRLGETRAVFAGFLISIVVYICYGFATAGWMIYAIILIGSFAGISGPTLQAYITKHVPPTEQGAVQGLFAGVMSLAGIPGPSLSTQSFSWAIGKGAIHLPWIFAALDDPLNWFADHLLPRHPGLPFFEAAVLIALAFILAARAFSRDRRKTAAASAAPSSAAA